MENTINDLIKTLRITVVRVHFTKIDGTERIMFGTLNPMLIPKDKMPKSGSIDTPDKINESPIICVFDTDLQDWRSFRKDNLIDWSINQATDLGEDV